MIFKLNAAFVILASVSTLAQIRGAPLYPRHEGHDDSSAGTPPNSNQPDFVKQNGLDAQALNAKFATIKATDSCTAGEMACIDGGFAQCVGTTWVVKECAAPLRCYALPLVNKPGSSLVCNTREDTLARFKAAGVSGGVDGKDGLEDGGNNGGGDNDGKCEHDDDDEEDEDDDEDGFDEDDLPECGEEGAFDDAQPSATPSATPAAENHNYRRQASTIANFPPLGNTVTVTAAPSATTTSSPIITPTVVVGNNGIVTVTVVSTVTVSATDCAATSPATSSSTTIPTQPLPTVTVTATPTVVASSMQATVANTVVNTVPANTVPAISVTSAAATVTAAPAATTTLPPIILTSKTEAPSAPGKGPGITFSDASGIPVTAF